MFGKSGIFSLLKLNWKNKRIWLMDDIVFTINCIFKRTVHAFYFENIKSNGQSNTALSSFSDKSPLLRMKKDITMSYSSLHRTDTNEYENSLAIHTVAGCVLLSCNKV